MSLELYFILVLLGTEYGIEILSNRLNRYALKNPIPHEFKITHDTQDYQKSILYQEEVHFFQLFHQTYSYFLEIGFILIAGFHWIDQWIQSFPGNTLLKGSLALSTLYLLKSLLELPFSIYFTFNIEEKYGFNRTTPKTFFLDWIKSLLLALFLGSLIFSAVIFFFENTGQYAWIYAWLGFNIFQLFLTYLAPRWILPWFYQFQPLAEGNLKKEIETYAKSQALNLSQTYVIDGSKRTTKANAFFTGLGKEKRLVLFDTLLEKLTQSEILAVFAHEVGHLKKHHVLSSLLLSFFYSGILFFALSYFIQNPRLFQAFQIENPSIYMGLILLSIVYTPVQKIISCFTLAFSRRNEFQADQFSKETYGHPEALISALKKLTLDSRSHLTPHPFKVALEDSHPPILKRIEALRRSS